MTRCYLDEDFLLSTEWSRRLYHEGAAEQLILDYHTHLPPREVALDRRWENLTELWLDGDHYKWRAMRAVGIPESHITGEASAREKFSAWACTVPRTLRNPLYDWTHLELRRCFGIEELLSPETEESIWERANERLRDKDFSARGLLTRFRVDTVGTTDHPTDSLEWHGVVNAAAQEGGAFETRLYPTFRPDLAGALDRPESWRGFVRDLDEGIASWQGLLRALEVRHAAFHEAGCRLSDHGLVALSRDWVSDEEGEHLFQRAWAGQSVSAEESLAFATRLVREVAIWNAQRGWTLQLHLGPVRNASRRGFEAVGADSGFDTFGDQPQGPGLLAFLDGLDREKSLPRTILYPLNARDQGLFAAAAGVFQEGPVAGKVQLGSGWWFNDTLMGMTEQLNTLSSVGLLFPFVGMLTDSRSFLSFPRHEYFRRLLCELVGREVSEGRLPAEEGLLFELVRGVAFENARAYFALPHHEGV